MLIHRTKRYPVHLTDVRTFENVFTYMYMYIIPSLITAVFHTVLINRFYVRKSNIYIYIYI